MDECILLPEEGAYFSRSFLRLFKVVAVEATTITPSQYDAFMGCSFPGYPVREE
jgi:hypothetical protein